jgi:hypothetical protein
MGGDMTKGRGDSLHSVVCSTRIVSATGCVS